MSTVTIAVIVAAVIVVAVLMIGVMAVLRRRRLQQRFGPEYDRLADERDSKRKAESESSLSTPQRMPSHHRKCS